MVTCVVFHLKLPVKGISMFMSSIDLDFSTVTALLHDHVGVICQYV